MGAIKYDDYTINIEPIVWKTWQPKKVWKCMCCEKNDVSHFKTMRTSLSQLTLSLCEECVRQPSIFIMEKLKLK